MWYMVNGIDVLVCLFCLLKTVFIAIFGNNLSISLLSLMILTLNFVSSYSSRFSSVKVFSVKIYNSYLFGVKPKK